MTDRFPLARALSAGLACAVTLALPVGAQEQPDEPAGAPQTPAEAPATPQAPVQAAPPAAPKKPDRVYLKDLEGTWIARDYVERLRASRAPHATSRQATGIAIKIQREGGAHPILITDFQRAVLQAVIDVQPDVKPKSYRLAIAKEDRGPISARDLTYIYFRGERNASGVFQTLQIAEPNFARKRFLTYLRLSEPLETFVNRAVIAGRYQDAEGQSYEFTEEGEAILPDRSFAYEVSLDPRNARCELLQSHPELEPDGEERIGYRWKGAQLELYEVSGKKAPYKCQAKPFAVLKRA